MAKQPEYAMSATMFRSSMYHKLMSPISTPTSSKEFGRSTSKRYSERSFDGIEVTRVPEGLQVGDPAVRNPYSQRFNTSAQSPNQVRYYRSRRRKAYWTVAGILTALMLGGVIGGLGVALAIAKSECQPVSATPSPVVNSTSGSPDPTYRAPDPALVRSLSLDCPARDGQTYTSSASAHFTQHCGVDYGTGDGISDLQAIVVYRVQECMDACASYNKYRTFTGGSRCSAVTFSADLSYNYDQFGANCWLKNATSSGRRASTYLSAALDESSAD